MAKRRRPRRTPEKVTFNSSTTAIVVETDTKQSQSSILELPTELLILIFSHFSFEEIGRNLRPVSRRFSYAACCALNSALLGLGARLQHALDALAVLMQSENQDDALRTVNSAVHILQTLLSQHRLLLAVTRRALDAAAGRCMYAGDLLDEMVRLLSLARHDPARLVLLNSATFPKAVEQLVEKLRRFMDHFERVVEQVAEPSWLPGAKALDLMDCGLEVRRQVVREEVGDKLHLRVHYSMPWAYFIALPLIGPTGDAGCRSQGQRRPRDERRLLFLRLRRLVQHHNEYALQKQHRERLGALCGTPDRAEPPLTASFVGYGESDGHFFYYGNLNERAFRLLCADQDKDPPVSFLRALPAPEEQGVPQHDSDDEDFLIPVEDAALGPPIPIGSTLVAEPAQEEGNAGSSEAGVFWIRRALPVGDTTNTRQTDLRIQVDLHCDMELAPFADKYSSLSEAVSCAVDDTGSGSGSGSGNGSRTGFGNGSGSGSEILSPTSDSAVPSTARPRRGVVRRVSDVADAYSPTLALRIVFHCPLALQHRLPAVATCTTRPGSTTQGV